MPQRNRPTPHIHLLTINPQYIRTINRHRRKRLVDLNQVDVVVQGEVVLGKEFGNRERGAYAHDAGRDARDRRADEFCEDGLVQLLCPRAGHEEECGCAVGDLARVAAGAAVAVLGEGGADLGEGFEGCPPPRPFVFGQGDRVGSAGFGVGNGGFDGEDFVGEPAVFLGVLGAGVG